jgi:glycosyltransferase involved in cell wall biosynthesis
MPKVSVIIPTHNRADFLRGALTSILDQTFQDFEIIVVDDASNDNTSEVVASFNDERINLVRHETNKGGSAARNTGILASKGDYIAFLDDDDEWFPDKLAKQIDILRSSPPEVGCVYTGYVDVDRNTGRVIGQQIPTKKGNLSKELSVENCLGSASSVLLKRECLKKVGLFDGSLPCSQDYDLWLRISNEFLFECVQAPLFKYSVHSNKISTNPKARSQGLAIMQQKYGYSRISRKYFSDAYSDVGIMYCLSGNTQAGREAFLKAIKASPMRVRGYSNLCLSLFGVRNFRRVKETKLLSLKSVTRQNTTP